MTQKEKHISPKQVLQAMWAKDNFSKWLGLKVDEVSEGSCKLHFKVTKEMLNGFGIIHGGALFAACDSAFAFACNSHGLLSVALDVSITFTKAAKQGEQVFIEAKEINLSNKTGVYQIMATNSKGEMLALFKGTSYRTSESIKAI